MKLKAVIAAMLGAALMCAASGCDITDLSKEDMLRPPKSIGDEEEIEKLISDTASGGYTLKYPKSGSNRSAIVMHDLDSDGNDEAIAFFRDKDGATGVHMLVMYDDDETWKVSSDFVTETTDVDCVDFSDITGNGSQEILTGYSTFAAGVNFLSAYTYEKGKTNAIDAGQNYSSFYCGNLDNSGKNKIIALSLFSPENEAKATLLEYDDKRKSLSARSSVPMDSGVTAYKNAVFSDLTENTRGLVVDGALSNGELNTQVIYFNRQLNVLRNPLYKEKTVNPTQRGSAVFSTDLGNDMKVEIPTVSSLPFNEESGAFTAADQVLWNNFSVEQEALLPAQRTVANDNYNYTIRIPDTWQAGSFTALLNKDGNEMRFCEWSKSGAGRQLFDVKVFKVTDWDKGNGVDNYVLINKDNRYAYAFSNSRSDSPLAMDDDEIKTAFSLLSGPAASK